MTIPRTIHQTLPDKSRLPVEVRENIARLKALNPGWRHVFHDDQDVQDFVRLNYGAEMLKVLNSINPLYGAARADLFRYLLMFKEGGVYLDIKSGCTVPFESFVRDDDVLLLSHWRNGVGERFQGWGMHGTDGVQSEFQNWHIICAPGHPALQAVIEAVVTNVRSYSSRRFGVGALGVLRTTGPIAYSKAIAPLLGEHSHRLFDSEEAGLVYSVFFTDTSNARHRKLFKQHYTRLKLPLVSAGPQTALHHIRHGVLNLLGLRS